MNWDEAADMLMRNGFFNFTIRKKEDEYHLYKLDNVGKRVFESKAPSLPALVRVLLRKRAHKLGGASCRIPEQKKKTFISPPERKNSDETRILCPSCRVWKGVDKSTCPLCGGLRYLPERYRIFFSDEAWGTTLRSLKIDCATLPLILTEQANRAYPDKTMRIWQVPLDEIFNRICAEIDVHKHSHFMYINYELRPFGSLFCPVMAGANRSGHDPDPPLRDIRRYARKSVARHLAWYARSKTTDWKSIVVSFSERPSTEQLMYELEFAADKKGYAPELIVFEGNIGTGERGWGVLLHDLKNERPTRFVSCEHDLAVALKKVHRMLLSEEL